ncbi:MAG: DUF4241 domain-containing protein [Methanomassiliicoccaceae archaeon]|nr:DUF4241 domain-containing protein [Methanomassiliicoccaceae archaeon]
MPPMKKWLEIYEEKKPLLTCEDDLNAYFTASEIAGKKLDRLSIGTVSLPSGEVIACDPLAGMGPHNKPYFMSVPPGEYEVVLSVVVPGESGDCARYAAACVRFSDVEAARYELALTGNEDLSELKEGEFFGFAVDAGLACVCDVLTRDALVAYEKERRGSGGWDNLYDDCLAKLMAENYRNHPLHQREGGDWLDWQVPGTGYNMPIFQSGFGDGYYPVWFGYDENGDICSLVMQFIDIQRTYANADKGQGKTVATGGMRGFIEGLLDSGGMPGPITGAAMKLSDFDPASPKDMSRFQDLLYWLFIFDRTDEALELTEFVKDLAVNISNDPFLTHCLCIRSRLLREKGSAEADDALASIREYYAGEQKLLRRLLKGSLLNDDKVKAYEDEGNMERANAWRINGWGWLFFIREMGGSKEFPIEEAERRIMETKGILRDANKG